MGRRPDPRLAVDLRRKSGHIVTGFMYAADMAAPTPSVLTTAIGAQAVVWAPPILNVPLD